MYCQNCGKEIEAGNKFCSFCGTKAPVPQQNIPAAGQVRSGGYSAAAVAKNRRGSRTKIIIAVAIAAVVIIAVALGIMLLKKPSGSSGILGGLSASKPVDLGPTYPILFINADGLFHIRSYDENPYSVCGYSDVFGDYVEYGIMHTANMTSSPIIVNPQNPQQIVISSGTSVWTYDLSSNTDSLINSWYFGDGYEMWGYSTTGKYFVLWNDDDCSIDIFTGPNLSESVENYHMQYVVSWAFNEDDSMMYYTTIYPDTEDADALYSYDTNTGYRDKLYAFNEEKDAIYLLGCQNDTLSIFDSWEYRLGTFDIKNRTISDMKTLEEVTNGLDPLICVYTIYRLDDFANIIYTLDDIYSYDILGLSYYAPFNTFNFDEKLYCAPIFQLHDDTFVYRVAQGGEKNPEWKTVLEEGGKKKTITDDASLELLQPLNADTLLFKRNTGGTTIDLVTYTVSTGKFKTVYEKMNAEVIFVDSWPIAKRMG